MKKSVKKPLHITLQIILWALSIIFILAGLGWLGQSLVTAILFLLIGLALLPPLWRAIAGKNPSKSARIARGIGLFGLIAVSVIVTPEYQSPRVSEPVVSNTPVAQSSTSGSGKDKPAGLSGLVFKDGTYAISGSGLASAKYSLKFSDSPRVNTETNEKGEFTQNIPADAQAFGRVELVRDVNGAWFGGEEVYDSKYFALNERNSLFNNELPSPVILGIGKAEKHDISGYYLPGTELDLKSGTDTLSSTKVDKSGRYKFEGIDLKSNFSEVAIYQKISTGWLSSKLEQRGDKRFLDIESNHVLSELPIIVREVTESKVIPYNSKVVESNRVNKGESIVTQDGVVGSQTITYRITYRGNSEEAREVVRNEVTKQPVDKITTNGTYVYVAPAPAPTPYRPSTPPSSSGGGSVYYANCTAVRAAGAAPIYRGQPGYRSALDRDNDGVGCE